MGALAEAVSGAVSGIADIGFGLYDREYQRRMNARDFDYQKSLQQEIFNREDTAVQRRMADLKAAGLNPNLAAGSAASSGSVVGRSSTPGLPGVGNPIGTALDNAMAVSQLRAQRKQNEILENQKKIQNIDYLDKSINQTYNTAVLMQQLGMNPRVTFSRNGVLQVHADAGTYNTLDSPIGRILRFQQDNAKNSAFLLQKDAQFYYADKIVDYIGQAARDAAQIGGAFKSFNYQAPNYNTYSNKYSQNFYANPYIKNSW